jgi:hypothetical protein
MVVKGVFVEDNDFHFSMNKKLFYFMVVFLIILALVFLGFSFSRIIKLNINNQIPICGDGSFPGTCSVSKPFYCNDEGVLVSSPDICGCPNDFQKEDGFCTSKYKDSPKKISLKYNLNGEENFIEFTAYEGFDSYLYSLKQSITYYDGEDSSRADFKLNKINQEIQREFIMPLVTHINNLDLDEDDKARVAVSLVQNIPFGESNKTFIFGNQEVAYSRYPYQVLYDNEGICGEKTELLSFLLRELGYGVSFFYYPDENHEALGIKCSIEKSFSNTGYCFVETTGPSIISDNEIIYSDIGQLYSVPELYFISEGLTFGENGFYEFRDANKLQRIRSGVEKRGWIGPLRKFVYEKLREKYGLVDEYYSG